MFLLLERTNRKKAEGEKKTKENCFHLTLYLTEMHPPEDNQPHGKAREARTADGDPPNTNVFLK